MLPAAVSLLPVLAFLGGLVLMDSLKLAPLRAVARSLGAGVLAALAAALVNRVLLAVLPVAPAAFSLWVAPLVEESLKALYAAWLVRTNRTGFLVDAAIHGFAVGTGFALVENAEYAAVLSGSGIVLWLARGLGTALLHGSTTTVFAILAKVLVDRRGGRASAFLPGLALAVVLHAVFNRFAGHSLAGTVAVLVLLPLVVVAAFEEGERATRHWLGVGFDSDAELWRSILSGEFEKTRVGAYIRSLRGRFPGEVVADMLCLLRIRSELSLRAKGVLIARKAGLELPIGDDVRANLAEMRYLERSIGPTGLLALHAVQTRSRRDLWQIYMLERG